ncbi:MAG: hypothetical protein M1828_005091 [Chrysothrix sp. TS-e1954]|nr:MAG: hypothetical protein M1828_005091 [Chrysothrix sp. TS-e1954]
MATASTQSSGSVAFAQYTQYPYHPHHHQYNPHTHYNPKPRTGVLPHSQQQLRQETQQHQQQSRLPTPASSTSTTPSTASPASPPYLLPAQTNSSASTAATSAGSTLPPHFGVQSRQLRPARSPLYVPAVLRPTEHFGSSNASSKQKAQRHRRGQSEAAAAGASPLTPPASATGSLDGHEAADDGVSDARLKFLKSRRGSWIGEILPAKIARIVTDEWTIDEGRMEDVTGLPTRDHWKPPPPPSKAPAKERNTQTNIKTKKQPDSSTTQCENTPTCPQNFTFLIRRHHCRRCGRIFCAPCSCYAVPLDQHARFHPSGRLARACDSCWEDFGGWERARRERKARRAAAAVARGMQRGNGAGDGATDGDEEEEEGDSSDASGSGSGSGSATPVAGLGAADEEIGRRSAAGKAKKAKAKTKGEAALVGSVPRDWNWSTF